MTRNIKTISIKVIALVACWSLLCLLVYFVCPYSLTFAESCATFSCNGEILKDIATIPGGPARIIALWLVQWCTTPVASSLVLGTLLTATAFALAVFFKHIIGGDSPFICLSILPAIALIGVQTEIDYSLAGTVAFTLAAAALTAIPYSRPPLWRLVISLALGIVLWYVAASAAMLFAATVLCVEIVKASKWAPAFTVTPAVICLLAYVSVRHGNFSDMGRALLPTGWYTPWLTPDNGALMPWGLALASVIICALCSRFVKFGKNKVAAGIVFAASIAAIAQGIGKGSDFAEISYYLAKEDWEGVAKAYEHMPKDDMALQNAFCLAQAERGLLGHTVFHNPAVSDRSIFDMSTRNRYDYMVLSDIFWSMGLVGASQRYAFEANEAVGDLSPRMLKRLVDTNIVFNDYRVARKYTGLLKSMRRYRPWAEQREDLIARLESPTGGNAALPQDLADKRACLMPDNRFAGYYGVDNDLLHVLRANPHHRITLDYLGTLYLLRTDIPRFMALMEEFKDTDALPMPLPEHFQEAVAVASIIDDSDIYKSYQVHPSVIERCTSFWRDKVPQPQSLWQYMRSRRQTQESPADETATHG